MPDELFSVADQVVLVSGGSRGIGRALAEGFARRGATVVITGRDSSALEQTSRDIAPPGGTVRPIVCDVADGTAIQRLVDTVLRDFGRVDTLLNVAGVNRRMPAERLTPADYDLVMDINLKGPFLLSLAVGKAMLPRGRGTQIEVPRRRATAILFCDKELWLHALRDCVNWRWRGVNPRVPAIPLGG